MQEGNCYLLWKQCERAGSLSAVEWSSGRRLCSPEVNERLRSSRCRATSPQLAQLSFRNSELSNPTIQADNEFRKYQHGALIPISGKVNVDLGATFCLVVRSAQSTSHDVLRPIPARSGLILAGNLANHTSLCGLWPFSLLSQKPFNDSMTAS